MLALLLISQRKATNHFVKCGLQSFNCFCVNFLLASILGPVHAYPFSFENESFFSVFKNIRVHT